MQINGKVFWFDLETTGLNTENAAIIQLAGLMEIDGEVRDSINIRVRPHDGAEVSDQALEVNGVSRLDFMSFMPAGEALEALRVFLGKYINKFTKEDKAWLAGYNAASFDTPFLRNMFTRQGDKFFGSWFRPWTIDPMHVLVVQAAAGLINLPNFKLTSACEYFGVDLPASAAHDALADITATRELARRLFATMTVF